MALIYKEVILRGSTVRARDIIKIIEDFCGKTEDYTYLYEETEVYRKVGGDPDSCAILDAAWPDKPCICFSSLNGVCLEIANVVPDQGARIEIADYNEIIDRFIGRFRVHCRTGKHDVRVRLSSDKLTLKSIIPGEKIRKCFEQYLARYPTSYHPLDIERLDKFICAAFRYGRQPLNTARLGRYLVEVLKWKQNDARWCCDRIETGTDILSLYRRF